MVDNRLPAFRSCSYPWSPTDKGGGLSIRIVISATFILNMHTWGLNSVRIQSSDPAVAIRH